VCKSFILDYVIQHLELQGKKILTMAIRHAAAVIIGGKTVSHYLHKFKAKGGAPRRGTIVVIDEWSEVQLHTWSELIKWKIVGVQFILVGDADGQRKPICDQWQKAMDAKDIRESQFIWELCGGLRVKLNRYRRGIDQKLFNDYTSLYVWADLNVYVGDTRNWGLGEYGSLKKKDHCFVISHANRIPANKVMVYCKSPSHEGPIAVLAGTTGKPRANDIGATGHDSLARPRCGLLQQQVQQEQPRHWLRLHRHGLRRQDRHNATTCRLRPKGPKI
jgi:hypothetical protein